ncbi:MAG: HlyD family efflux transporter periplasmic adaptor subunit [Wujia sp.]
MSRKSNNIIKFNRDIKINAATCLIAAILLYVVISIIIASKKEPITTYKVNKTNINNDIILTGLIIRDEEVLSTSKSGYICYYIRDGEKVKKDSAVCTIDETGKIHEAVNNTELYDELLTEQDYKDIRSLISLYKVTYKDSEFYTAYNFENNANNKVLELTNEILMQQVNNDNSYGISSVLSPYSGVITYYVDGYEDFDIANISSMDFDKSLYEKNTLKTGDVTAANSPVAKVIPSEDWNIIAPISAEQISQISEYESIKFRINNSSYIIKMPYEIIYNSDGTYINIMLNQYMSNFISERYVDVEIIREDDTGLKVPISALIDKTVYKIPIDYLSGGGNQNYSNRFNVQVMGEDGQITINQVTPTIYKKDEEFCYVDPAAFENTDVLLDIETNNTCAVSLLSTATIKGVYSANRGIAEFEMVEVIKIVDEFALVSSTGGLKEYDNIILNSEKVTENQIIY